MLMIFWIFNGQEQYKKMFGFIKQMFFRLLRVCTMKGFGESLVSNSKGPIKYVSLDNQSYQARPKLVHINSN